MFDKLLDTAPNILRALAKLRIWDYVGIVLLMGVFTTLYIAWDARQALINRYVVSNVETSSQKIEPSPETIKAGRDLVHRAKSIIAVQIVNVDWRTNTRSTAMFYSDDQAVAAAMQKSFDNMIVPPALLTNDPENNLRFKNILSGRFICSPVENTWLIAFAPDIAPTVKAICSISIPPYPGKFSGYINLFIDRIPDDEHMTMLETLARMYSSDIFLKDVGR